MVSFSELKRLEIAAIRAIQTEGVFGRLDSLLTAAKQAQIAVAPKASIDVNLSFVLPTRLREDKGQQVIERAFHVGCLAVPSTSRDEIAHLSYSVLIGKDAHPEKRVARKFHFDFEPVSIRNEAESKPTFHLQICGELSKHHINEGYSEQDILPMLPSWSQPRVPSQPMSIALLLNWLFIEFGSEAAVKDARLSPGWRKLVRNSERTVLKPYYEACSNFLSSSANDDKSFFAEHIYQER